MRHRSCAAASKAMAVDTLNSITYSGTARNGAFGQSKAIGEPMGAVNVTQITQYADDQLRTGGGTALVSRATGPTQPPSVPGVPPQPAGVFNQNITGAQAGSSWAQALNIWTTPWGFLESAAANKATVGSRAASSSCRSRRRMSNRRRDRPTPSPVTSTRPTRSPKSKRLSTTPSLATCRSSSNTPTTRT